MYDSNENVHAKYLLTTFLQRQHINETNPKYKNHAKYSKTKQAQSRITASKKSSVDEEHTKVRNKKTLLHNLANNSLNYAFIQKRIENINARITRAFQGCNVAWLTNK